MDPPAVPAWAALEPTTPSHGVVIPASVMQRLLPSACHHTNPHRSKVLITCGAGLHWLQRWRGGRGGLPAVTLLLRNHVRPAGQLLRPPQLPHPAQGVFRSFRLRGALPQGTASPANMHTCCGVLVTPPSGHGAGLLGATNTMHGVGAAHVVVCRFLHMLYAPSGSCKAASGGHSPTPVSLLPPSPRPANTVCTRLRAVLHMWCTCCAVTLLQKRRNRQQRAVCLPLMCPRR